ncbi:hypothetical protein V1477_003688 [Vespula maculifrons]|uniref:Uncharacterized protein n=1 Tax=Vespula maculifrons TaxID=7453 RepID=A0ABD2CRP8_VESMC
MPRLREYAGFIEFQRGTTKRDGIWHSSYHSAFLEDTIAGESKCQGNSSGRPRYDDCKEVEKKEKEEEEEEDEEEDEEDRRRISSFVVQGVPFEVLHLCWLTFSSFLTYQQHVLVKSVKRSLNTMTNDATNLESRLQNFSAFRSAKLNPASGEMLLPFSSESSATLGQPSAEET